MPSIERFAPRELGPKPGGTELLVASTDHYTGKVLMMHAGHRGGLQYHVAKDETFHLWSGRCLVRYEQDGQLVEAEMWPGESYHVPIGAIHQVIALEDSILFEASVPSVNDRVNVGEQFKQGEMGNAW